MKRIISLSICMVFLLSASTIFLAQEKMEERMTFPQFKDEVKRIIRERNAFLLVHFIKGEYGEMPGKLKGYQTKLVTHKGDVIKGEASVNYWEEIGVEGTELNFKDPDLKFMKFKVSTEPGDIYDYVAVEVTEFSFRKGRRTYRGLIDPTYRHRVECIVED
jgi:hypothetical protein